jgi:peptide-methionine (R)-S-oxide reductase
MRTDLTRRSVLFGATALPLIAACQQASAAWQNINSAANEARYVNSPFRHLTAEDWRQRLSPDAFHIMREEGTERTFTSPLLNEHRRGVFQCAGCGLELYQSAWKFDSGTGWPSFFEVMTQNVGTHPAGDLLNQWFEIHCAQCLGHLGHVFSDGPPPTGLRYCMDGVALRFVPAA